MKGRLSQLILSAVLMLNFAAWGSEAQTSKKVIILTIPKSGTHLIHAAAAMIAEKPVREIGRERINFNAIDFDDRNVDIYHLHPEFNSIQQLLVDNAKVIILVRDPRDALISQIFWIATYRFNPHHCSLDHFLGLDFHEKIQLMLQDPLDQSKPYSHPYVIPYFVKQAVNWMHRPDILVCRFEDLVGPKGGGDRTRQVDTIRELANFMGNVLSEDRIEYIADHIFGVNEVLGVGNFRTGQIGSWKSHFETEDKAVFKERMGQELIELGYERDYNW